MCNHEERIADLGPEEKIRFMQYIDKCFELMAQKDDVHPAMSLVRQSPILGFSEYLLHLMADGYLNNRTTAATASEMADFVKKLASTVETVKNILYGKMLEDATVERYH